MVMPDHICARLRSVAPTATMERHTMTVYVPTPSRPICTDLDSSCFQLPFCEACRCSVELRRGLVGRLAFCPISGISAVAQYPGR
ncbi:MAG: hypothetical protein ACXVZP_11785 [Gaiellaceae bacterium]